MAKILITELARASGMTRAFLARAGHQGIATMRNPGASDLEKVASEAKLPVTVLALDVDDDASVTDVYAKVGSSIDVLVINPGIYSITSIAGRIAHFASSAYAASKFAREALTESLAQEVNGYGIQVALVEPGIIDTAMATTNLPQYDEKTIYRHGRRLQAFFKNPAKPEASPTLVAEMIRYVIESGDPRLRFPVGPDALPFIGWRSR